MRRVGSHDSDLLRSISSGLLSCRVLPEVSPLPAEVREDGEARAALRRLPSAAAGADQPIAGALRPQVQEGQEELHLQVRSRVFFFSRLAPNSPPSPPPLGLPQKSFLGPPSPCSSSPGLCRADAVFTYFPCLSFAHLANCFPCASLQTGLSTFIGTTGNATCFPSTASATAPRGSPASTSPCTRKKVKAPFGGLVGSRRAVLFCVSTARHVCFRSDCKVLCH